MIKNLFFNRLAMAVWIALLVYVGIFLFPWHLVSWGRLTFGQERTVTVVGSSQQQTKNQIATFTAGATSIKDKKEDAVNEVNQKMEEIVKAVKAFGVKSEDIQTQNSNIYQTQETFYEEGRQKTRPGQWSVNNSIAITLREVDRASALSDILSKSGANNVNGPMFSIDTKASNLEALMMEQAIDNARSKAVVAAAKVGAKLGAVVAVQEGYGSPQIYPLMGGMGGGGGGPVVEAGTSTVSKTVTVTFRLE